MDSQRTVFVRQGDDFILNDELRARESRERAVSRLRLLWARRRFLSRALACGFVASLLIAFLIPSEYQSTTRLMPPDQQGSGELGMLAAMLGTSNAGSNGGGGGSLAGLATDILGVKNAGDLFMGVLGSRTVQDDLVDKFDLRRIYRVRRWSDARKTLAENTDIASDKKSGIIKLTVTDRNPQRAAAMAGEYVAELNRVMAQVNTSSAHRERVFLGTRLEQVRTDLESAEKDFGQFASKNTALNVTEQGKAMIEAAATLQGQLIAAQTELGGLKQIYTDNNVRVRSLQARVDELQRQLTKLGGKPGNAADPEAEQDNFAYPSFRQLPLLGIDYADLLRRTKTEEAVFGALTQEYELAKVQEAKELPSVKVLDAAEVPETKASPQRVLISLVGAFLGLGLGMAWVMGSSRWQEIDMHDPGKALAEEVFGGVRKRLSWGSSRDLGPTPGPQGGSDEKL